MPDIVDPGVERYAEAHTSPPPGHLVRLAEETTEKLAFPQMMVGSLEGQFLQMLVFAISARRVLEIGTFSGYSALSMAAGLPDGGHIITCELSPAHAEVAERHIASSAYADRIEVKVGPAIETIGRLDGPFDFVFIDADKAGYPAYYEAVLPKLAPRGMIALDNTLQRGAVVDASATNESVKVIRELNDRLVSDERVACVLLPVRDGVTLVRRVS